MSWTLNSATLGVQNFRLLASELPETAAVVQSFRA